MANLPQRRDRRARLVSGVDIALTFSGLHKAEDYYYYYYPTIYGNRIYQFSVAPIANYHRFRSLKQYKWIVLQFWRFGVQMGLTGLKSRCFGTASSISQHLEPSHVPVLVTRLLRLSPSRTDISLVFFVPPPFSTCKDPCDYVGLTWGISLSGSWPISYLNSI